MRLTGVSASCLGLAPKSPRETEKLALPSDCLASLASLSLEPSRYVSRAAHDWSPAEPVGAVLRTFSPNIGSTWAFAANICSQYC